jgi:hypothetical protein
MEEVQGNGFVWHREGEPAERVIELRGNLSTKKPKRRNPYAKFFHWIPPQPIESPPLDINPDVPLVKVEFGETKTHN